jgi:hypothetical protein
LFGFERLERRGPLCRKVGGARHRKVVETDHDSAEGGVGIFAAARRPIRTTKFVDDGPPHTNTYISGKGFIVGVTALAQGKDETEHRRAT